MTLNCDSLDAEKDRITHRIPIASLAEIDDEVKRWVKKAYELDA